LPPGRIQNPSGGLPQDAAAPFSLEEQKIIRQLEEKQRKVPGKGKYQAQSQENRIISQAKRQESKILTEAESQLAAQAESQIKDLLAKVAQSANQGCDSGDSSSGH